MRGGDSAHDADTAQGVRMQFTLKAMYITGTTPAEQPAVAVMIPAYPGAISQGDTMADARQNVLDAIADLIDFYNADVAAHAATYRAAGATVV